MRVTFSVVLGFAATIAASLASAQTTQTPQMAYVNVSPPNPCPPPCESVSCDAGYSCDPIESDHYNIVTPFWQSDGINDFCPTWSPDATRIAFMRSSDIFVADATGANPLGITHTYNNSSPAWSPDGARIAFASSRDTTGGAELYLMNP